MFAVSNVLARFQHKIYIRKRDDWKARRLRSAKGERKHSFCSSPLGIIVNSEAQQEFPSKLNVNFKKYFYY